MRFRIAHDIVFSRTGRLRSRAFAVHPYCDFSAGIVGSHPCGSNHCSGSTLIIGISALATNANANPWILVIAATAGAIIGDGLSFWLGQRYHREILNSWPLNKYPHLIARSEIFVTQYGATSVFLARFAPVVRAFVPLVSGILRMSPLQFYAANILSAFAWAPAHIFPGVLLAMALQLTIPSAEQRTILVFAGLIVATFIIFATRSVFKVR